VLDELNILLSIAKINLSEEQKQKIISYIELLCQWNKTYNFTSVHDPKEMLIKHVLDSIIVAPYLKGRKFIDVGTGPGLPGLLLAIVLPDSHFTLLDSIGKRICFLRQVQQSLRLTNIQPIQSRVESFFPSKRFDGVISRAFASLKNMLSCCEHLVDKTTGCFYALKGVKPDHELADLPSQITLKSIFKLQIPKLEAERHLIVLKINALFVT